jgi:hypothetical protein
MVDGESEDLQAKGERRSKKERKKEKEKEKESRSPTMGQRGEIKQEVCGTFGKAGQDCQTRQPSAFPHAAKMVE